LRLVDARAFSSEVDTSSRRENATNQNPRAFSDSIEAGNALERRTFKSNRTVALTFCLSIGFSPKPVSAFGSDALDPDDFGSNRPNQDFAVYILGLDRWAMINRFQEIGEIEEDIKNIVATIKNVTVTLAWMDEAVARLKWVRDRLEDAEGQSGEVATVIPLRPPQKRNAGRPRKNTSKASK